MKFKSIISLLTAFASAQQIVPDTGRQLNTDPPVEMICGDTNTVGEKTYRTWERFLLCLVFPEFPGGPRKVIFNPEVDKFEVL